MSRVVVRSFQKDDAGLIVSTWSKSAYKDADVRPAMNRREWFKLHYGYVCEVMDQDDVFIACLADDFSTILGYSVVVDGELQWVYVKPDFRGMGIGRMLEGVWPKSELHMTRTGRLILNKRKERENDEHRRTECDAEQAPTGVGGAASKDAQEPSRDLRNQDQQSEIPPGSN